MVFMDKPSTTAAAAIALIILVILSGCAELEDFVSIPTARVDSVEISGIDFDSVTILVNVEIDNPNPLGLTLDAYDYRLEAWQSDIVKGRVEDPVSLRPDGRSKLPIPVTMTFTELADAGASLIGADSIPLDIGLGLEIAIPYMGAIRLDLSAFIDIPIPRPPTIVPVRLKVDSINMSGARISLEMELGNPNSFGMDIIRLSGLFLVGGNPWGEISLEERINLTPGSRQSAVVGARISFADVGRSAWNLLSGSGRIQVTMSGESDIGMDIPGFQGSGLEWNADADVSIVR